MNTNKCTTVEQSEHIFFFLVYYVHEESEYFINLSMDTARSDSELPNKMALLDIMEVGESSVESVVSNPPSRILRKRKCLAPEPSKSSNRRVSMKPRKHISITENANPKQIEALYLNKKIKTLTQTLETIYEEPKSNNSECDNFIGGRKVKRLLTFQIGSQYTKEKIKKRRAKIKKLLGNKSFVNRKKIPMNVFLKTIECLELDEAVHSDNKTVESTTV